MVHVSHYLHIYWLVLRMIKLRTFTTVHIVSIYLLGMKSAFITLCFSCFAFNNIPQAVVTREGTTDTHLPSIARLYVSSPYFYMALFTSLPYELVYSAVQGKSDSHRRALAGSLY